jgi:hypothetical protein
MKRIWWSLLLTAALGMLLAACKTDSTTNPGTGHASIVGQVRDVTTANILGKVTVTAVDLSGANATQTASTDTVAGQYSFTFQVDSSASVLLSYSLTGYRDTSMIVTITSGVATPGNMYLTPKSVLGIPGSNGGTGLPQTIAFLGANPQQISVYGVGGLETSLLQWEVRDSLGIPIDASHAITLSVAIVNGPGGGEYVSPTNVTTNKNGQAYNTINAGTKSGPLQVVATGSVTVNGVTRTISSSPVKVIIASGYADQAHFTLAAPIYNLPILHTAGFRNKVNVLVGDKYSNPVATNTAVYFSSTAGVIQPSVFTTVDGQGSVDLISGNPEPFGQYADPVLGDGYHWITAKTMGDASTVIKDSIRVLWTYRSLITSLNPTTFDIANGGFQDFTFTVADYLGHPLSSGTSITVSASVAPPPSPDTPINQVLVSFGQHGSLVLPDLTLPGAGSTNFSFRLSDGTSGILDAAGSSVSLMISVSGPNGTANFTTDGRVH